MIKSRINNLRKLMKEYHIDFYLIPSTDYHNSEYVTKFFCAREYFSGFSGSNGTLLVSEKNACLWTDGRYFIQAKKELEGSDILLFKMQEPRVPTLLEYIADNVKEGQVIGFDGKVISASFYKEMNATIKTEGIMYTGGHDLVDEIWKERPKLPCNKISILPNQIAGESFSLKVSKLREKMKKIGVGAFLISKLDDIMWLYNIRGNDVPFNTVALSYTFITEEKAYLFIQKQALSPEDYQYFEAENITVLPYDSIFLFLKELKCNKKVLLDTNNCSYSLFSELAGKVTIIDQRNLTEELKAVKNNIEIEQLKNIYLKDSIAVTKFIYWLTQEAQLSSLNEWDVGQKIDSFRKEINEFLDYSFPTICAYKENAAMMHYSAKKQSAAILKNAGMLLVDSGGQYLGGTTDVTRTIILGPIDDSVRENYTAVVEGMLQLMKAKFLKGCTGRNLDILARAPLWNLGLDYKCGTGHGIGYMLNVHEGPHNISWRYRKEVEEYPIEAGMLVSDEPGVYLEEEYGIRIENILLCVETQRRNDDCFLGFEPLTFVPIDLLGILPKKMSESNKEALNRYHEQVLSKISPYLEANEKVWLKEVTKAI